MPLTESETCMRFITPALEAKKGGIRIAEQDRIVARVDELNAGPASAPSTLARRGR